MAEIVVIRDGFGGVFFKRCTVKARAHGRATVSMWTVNSQDVAHAVDMEVPETQVLDQSPSPFPASDAEILSWPDPRFRCGYDHGKVLDTAPTWAPGETLVWTLGRSGGYRAVRRAETEPAACAQHCWARRERAGD